MLLIYLKILNLKIYYYIKKLKYNIKISNSKGIIKIFNLYIKKLHLLCKTCNKLILYIVYIMTKS